MRCGIRIVGVAIAVLALAAPALRADVDEAFQKKINQAIDQGVAYLKQAPSEGGLWSFPKNQVNQGDPNDGDLGATALAGLTLLECGVPAKDEVVQKAAAAIREHTIKSTYTYALSLAIMFLDRLGDPGDVPLIESMTVRLLAGQLANGGWDYRCPAIAESEMRRLATHLKERSELIAKGQLPKTAPRKQRTKKDLPREIVAQLVQINSKARNAQGTGDNSNTQFAAIALWIARRHGLPVGDALARISRSFRIFQAPNGGWTYGRPRDVRELTMLGGPMVTPSMTCAGLIGLAVGNGAINEAAQRKNPKAKPPTDFKGDKRIIQGFAALATCIGEPAKEQGDIPNLRRNKGEEYYYLWSLERVAMIYDLKKIGKKDWYAWGSEILVNNQSEDGSWQGKYAAGGVDTCFALLFLKRSNLAADLTSSLKGKLKKVISESVLKSKLRLDKDIQSGIKPKLTIERDDRKPKKTRPAAIEGSGNKEQQDIARLSAELVQAAGEDQEKVLAELTKGKGLKYTEALAGSIPLLKGSIKAKARQALAQRLTRMSVKTLGDKFEDDNLEVRRAAALACAKKKARGQIPGLIRLLDDPELPVALAALQALKDLSGKDFGPEADATRAERKAAVDKWKQWWKQNKE